MEDMIEVQEIGPCVDCGHPVVYVDGYPEQPTSDGKPSGVEHECNPSRWSSLDS